MAKIDRWWRKNSDRYMRLRGCKTMETLANICESGDDRIDDLTQQVVDFGNKFNELNELNSALDIKLRETTEQLDRVNMYHDERMSQHAERLACIGALARNE